MHYYIFIEFKEYGQQIVINISQRCDSIITMHPEMGTID